MTAIAEAVEVNNLYLKTKIDDSVPCFSPGKQKQEKADRHEDDCSGEAHGRNFGAGMIIFFKSRGESDEETEKPNAEHNHADRSLIVGRDFHGWGNQI